jgi:competence protein ComEA
VTVSLRRPATSRAEVAARVRAILGRPEVDDVAVPLVEEGTLHRPDASAEPVRRGAVVVGVVAVVVGIVALGWVLAARPRATPVQPRANGPLTSVPASSAAVGRTSPVPTGSAAPTAEVVIDVAGKVVRPGVYRLPAGARVDDAIRAAGGALPGVSLLTLNLAAQLSDGQQVPVGVPAADLPVPAAGSTRRAAPTHGGGSLDLNTASADQLDALPGVGPVLAGQIVDWRTAHGRFTSVDQLTDVPGIGAAKLATLRALVSV